jgi:hypothetical protein
MSIQPITPVPILTQMSRIYSWCTLPTCLRIHGSSAWSSWEPQMQGSQHFPISCWAVKYATDISSQPLHLPFNTLFSVYGCFACKYVYCLCAWYPQKPEKGARSSETGVTISCEPPLRNWELNLGPLEEKVVLLSTELSL